MLAKCFSRLTLTQCCVPTIYIYTVTRVRSPGPGTRYILQVYMMMYIYTYIHTYRYVRVYVCMQVHIYLDNVPMDSLSRTRLHTHTHGSVYVKSHFRLYACLCLACWCLPVLNKNDKKSTSVICSICRGVHNWTSESFNVSGVGIKVLQSNSIIYREDKTNRRYYVDPRTRFSLLFIKLTYIVLYIFSFHYIFSIYYMYYTIFNICILGKNIILCVVFDTFSWRL